MLLRRTRTPAPPKREISAWQQGANAAREGLEPEDCPYERTSYDFVTWMNGWATAAYNVANGR